MAKKNNVLQKGIASAKANIKLGLFLRKTTYLTDFVALTVDLVNGKTTLPIPIPLFNQFWDELENSLLEMNQYRFMNGLVDTILDGYKGETGVVGINNFFFDYKCKYYQEEAEKIMLGFDFIRLTEKGLNTLLSGAITEFPTKILTEDGETIMIDKISDLFKIGYRDPENCGILVQREEGTTDDKKNNNKDHLDEYDRVIDIYNIVGNGYLH